MAGEILTPIQQRFIQLFSGSKFLKERFYLTGGIALAAYYLNHRYSEGLNFFSVEPVDILAIEVFLKEIKSSLCISKVDFQQSFNRNLFFLHTKKEILKTEFTYFPFEQVEKPVLKDGIFVDSLVDLGVNKAFIISQNPRSRDFIDLYLILAGHKEFSFDRFLKLARIKFDVQIDPIQLGSQLVRAKDIQDLPRMFQEIGHQRWRDYFIERAKSLSKDIFQRNSGKDNDLSR